VKVFVVHPARVARAVCVALAGFCLAHCGQDPTGPGGAGAGTMPDDPASHSADSKPIKSSTTKPGVAWSAPKSTVRQADRDVMVAHLRDYYQLQDQQVLDAMAACARHDFMPVEIADKAYADSPQPIPNGQLISQPWIVALMTHELQLKPDSRVLEIGTGSAYQAAILSYITPHVYSIEIIKPLAESAGERLTKLGYDCVQTRLGDGFNGWPDAAPFDAIIVTCAAGQIPPPLIKQLKKGGRMMIPVGQPFQTQSLMRVVKDMEGNITTESILPVRFVPMEKKDVTNK
jgi:protein-L-isoaspartate(D-aspartate) O-methyltransferase